MQAVKIHTLLTTTKCTLDTNFSCVTQTIHLALHLHKYQQHNSTNIFCTFRGHRQTGSPPWFSWFIALQRMLWPTPHTTTFLMPHFLCHMFPMFTFTCHMNTLDITKGFLANVFSMRKRATYCFTHDCKIIDL